MAHRQHDPASRQHSPGAFLVLLAGLTFALLVAVCLLPHDRTLRFASLTEPAVVKAGWIHQRIHDDPAPIDVAFIGTSRSVFGIDSAAVEAAYRDRTGRELHVVNFGLQHLGRNLHYLLAREAIEHRTLRMLVIEVNKSEPRDMHPAFGALADPADLLDAPLLLNLSYLRDLAALPRRQVVLAARTLWRDFFGGNPGSDPADYRGPHWDDTYAERGTASHPVRPRTRHADPGQLERQRVQHLSPAENKLSLPPLLAPLEHRATLAYLRRIVALAEAHHVAVRLLYLPGYGSHSPPAFAAFYDLLGPRWEPEGVAPDSTYWLDVIHLNHAGALAMSRWLAQQLAVDPSLQPTAR